MTQTVLGRSMFAIGGNKEAARVSGLKVGRIKISTYVVMEVVIFDQWRRRRFGV